jgi:hypothetical protein
MGMATDMATAAHGATMAITIITIMNDRSKSEKAAASGALLWDLGPTRRCPKRERKIEAEPSPASR